MKTLLPTKSKSAIRKELKKRKYENLELVETIEKYLKKKRGYVFKMPKRGSPVILLLSGGLDSVVVWKLLMDTYHLHVYPFVNKSSPQEYRSVAFFSKQFQSLRYFHEPFFADDLLSNKGFATLMRTNRIHPQQLLANLLPDGTVKMPSIKSIQSILPYFAAAYAQLLQYSHNIICRTILCGITSLDGEVVPSQTLASIRCTNLSLCLVNADHEWQYASLLFEPELYHSLSKDQSVALGRDMGLPLDKTWSCHLRTRKHCGECIACIYRKMAFMKSHTLDTTTYLHHDHPSLIARIKKRLTNWFG